MYCRAEASWGRALGHVFTVSGNSAGRRGRQAREFGQKSSIKGEPQLEKARGRPKARSSEMWLGWGGPRRMGVNTRKILLREVPWPCKILLSHLTPASDSGSELAVCTSSP